MNTNITSGPESSIRFHGLDFLRALMMSLGVVLHAAQFYLVMPILDYYWDPARSMSMDVLLIFINTFRMPTFFLMSGFFTAMLFSRRGLSGMLNNRYKRIVIPFLVFLPLLALIMTGLRILAFNVMETGSLGFDYTLVPLERLWNNTHNLWFLYYLIMFIAATWAVIQLTTHLPESWRRWLKQRVLERSVCSVPFIIFSAAVLALLGSINPAGRISGNLTFMPDLLVFLYFGFCYFLGWVLYQRLDDLALLAQRAWKYLILAILSLALGVVGFGLQGEPGTESYLPFHSLLSVCTGFSMVFFMLALVGLFTRYCASENPWMRYFSDSAYWVFIFHSVPQVVISLMLYHWEVAAELKFLVVCLLSFAACIASYQLFVRNSAIGELLNGKRYASRLW